MEHVADLNELPAGGRKSIFIDDVPAMLLRIGDQYFAVEDVCSHDGQPLTDGPVTEFEIACPRHGARFDVRTGKPTRMPATEAIAVYAVDVRADGIYAGPAETAAVAASSIAVTTTTSASTVSAPTASASNTVAAVAANDAVELEDTEIIEALRQVIDPELMINIVDLGLIYAINHGDTKVQIDMTLTSPACPAGPQLVQQSKMVLERIPGVTEAQIKLVMSPPWTPDRMTDEARDQLGIF
ncbi:MAG: iron-sulfur cluster assembly protein [Planctomycetaceae bacterium]|nr:iron-sulfur cluster assembly protein [Planctomycetaceae bacterium]